MAMMPKAQWEIEGELLQLQISMDKLNKRQDLTEDEKDRLADMEKRKEILQELLRKEKMKLK